MFKTYWVPFNLIRYKCSVNCFIHCIKFKWIKI